MTLGRFVTSDRLNMLVMLWDIQTTSWQVTWLLLPPSLSLLGRLPLGPATLCRNVIHVERPRVPAGGPTDSQIRCPVCEQA